jgi:Cof subfamily protein (haloacid dehalogenase superfamily)
VWRIKVMGSCDFDLKSLKLIASDMDGTLLDEDARIHDATHAAIEELECTTRIPLVLATGRSRGSALLRLCHRNLDWSNKAGIFLNGALIYGLDGELVKEHFIEMDVLKSLVVCFSDEIEKVVVLPCSGDAILSPVLSEVSLHLHENYADPYPTVFGSYSDMITHIESGDVKVHMISVSTSDDRDIEKDTIIRVKACLKEFDNSNEYCIVTPIPRLVTILPRNTCKGAALLELTRMLDIDPCRVAAIGDANNDVEMLQVVGLPVAMGNGKDELKNHAKIVVNPNNHPTLPGVAQFIREVVVSHM